MPARDMFAYKGGTVNTLYSVNRAKSDDSPDGADEVKMLERCGDDKESVKGLGDGKC